MVTAIKFGVTVAGMGFIRDAIASAPKAMEEALDEALNDVATLVAREAKRIVPVKTGKLRDSIFVRKHAFSKYEVVAATHYSGYVEYGTSRMVARPYLRPALYRYSSTWKQRVLDRFERKTRGMFRSK